MNPGTGGLSHKSCYSRRLPSIRSRSRRRVHDYDLKYNEFRPRTMWSLSKAFTSAGTRPGGQFGATARLGEYLDTFFAEILTRGSSLCAEMYESISDAPTGIHPPSTCHKLTTIVAQLTFRGWLRLQSNDPILVRPVFVPPSVYRSRFGRV